MKARQYMSLVAAVVVLGGHASGAQGTRDQGTRDRQMRFQAMDADRDGVITRAEWRGNLQSFRQHDRNNDGVLSGEEVWVAAQGGQNIGDANDQRSLITQFRRTDRNGDGLIARDEWYSDLATFERVDRNNDGRISQAEFIGEPEVAGTTGSMTPFDELDRNGNGVVTRNEWSGTRNDFAELDTDDDNVLTRAEYQARENANRTPAYRAGYTRGLAEGRQAGTEDRTINGGRWDLEGQRELEQADSGYTTAVGSRSDYQAGYRAGFRRGYEQGFGKR